VQKNSASVVRLTGGLGNQMFQYAFGQNLRRQTGYSVAYDARSLFDGGRIQGDTPRDYALNHLNTNVTFASTAQLESFGVAQEERNFGFGSLVNSLRRLKYSTRLVQEDGFLFDGQVMSVTSEPKYYSGYWQSWKYLAGVETLVRSEFQPRTEMDGEALELKERIKDVGGACLNVRRGDFVNNEKTRKFHGYMEVEYYNSALARLRDAGEFDHVFVFSDDLDWCEANLRLKGNVKFVSHSLAGPKFTHYLSLMAACSGFVIPNSTFGWWGAWLSGAPGHLVVAPKNWFADNTIDTSDLIPESWVRL